MSHRIEQDTLGEVKVPSDRYYGAQTARAIKHFAIGRESFSPEMIQALAVVKLAAARANAACGVLDARKAILIEQAGSEVRAGKFAEDFPISLWQSGSGTQTNMNINEVIAGRANQLAGQPLGSKSPIHPNDDVNKSQSTNDVFPTAMHLAAVVAVEDNLLPVLTGLEIALSEKATAFAKIVKTGRTHLMDAVPVTLGQEFSGYAHQLRECRTRLNQSVTMLYPLPIGGSAVGTGLNTPPEYAKRCIESLVELTGKPFVEAQNRFALMAAHDNLVQLSGSLKTLAVALTKIGSDIRLMGSGPVAGLGELRLPANEPGSSIMPGKVNPTQIETLTMVCAQVIGNDTAVTLGGMNGHFELNVYNPLIIRNILHSSELLSDAMQSFATYCIAGLEANEGQLKNTLDRNLMLVTALNPHIGYDKAAQIAKLAQAKNLTLRAATLQLGYLSAEQFDAIVKPEEMV